MGTIPVTFLNKLLVLLLAGACLHFDMEARAQTAPGAGSGGSKASGSSSLDQLSASLQAIAGQVEPSVVQIFSSPLVLQVERAGRFLFVVFESE